MIFYYFFFFLNKFDTFSWEQDNFIYLFIYLSIRKHKSILFRGKTSFLQLNFESHFQPLTLTKNTVSPEDY